MHADGDLGRRSPHREIEPSPEHLVPVFHVDGERMRRHGACIAAAALKVQAPYLDLARAEALR
jgi:hypothetical protein